MKARFKPEATLPVKTLVGDEEGTVTSYFTTDEGTFYSVTFDVYGGEVPNIPGTEVIVTEE